jgi:hypothetical protein
MDKAGFDSPAICRPDHFAAVTAAAGVMTPSSIAYVASGSGSSGLGSGKSGRRSRGVLGVGCSRKAARASHWRFSVHRPSPESTKAAQ